MSTCFQEKENKAAFIARLAAAPVTRNPVFFVAAFIMLMLPDALFLILERGEFPLLQFAGGFLLCYILALPALVPYRAFREGYKYSVLFVALSLLAVNVYCACMYGETLNYLHVDTVAAIRASNPDEIREYLNTYVTAWTVLLLVASAVFLLFLFRVADIRLGHLKRLSNAVSFLLAAYLLFSVVITAVKYDEISELNMFVILEKADLPDLREHRQNPVLEIEGGAPNDVVLVIGESFSSGHSSLYGYGKCTNPLLGRLSDEGELKVYSGATSYATTTIPAIKSLMTAYRSEYSDSIEWYKCLTLIEVMSKAGYSTNWISNHSKRGICDNEVGLFAELCDRERFVGNKMSGMDRTTYDESLLPLLDECIKEGGERNFYVIQMLGSHPQFSSRYPGNYACFKAGDYSATHPELSEESRQLLAEYDNSVLYNDRVVHDIMMRFKESDAVVIYLSDHGLDVFESSSSYIGHARKNDGKSVKAARKIPFAIYTTAKFREMHPDCEERIKSAVGYEFVSDCLMYSIMDIAGVKSVNGVSYSDRSLFRKECSPL